ncbi:MAG: DUF1801 domain-containing protein [Planctomycetes bacterium]|nr:DUF1801 domain-containing protein [Planctomycetota bacterium]
MKTDTTAAVEQWLASSKHPDLELIEALRRLVLAVDPTIAEGVKWNVPSFRTHEYFATMHVRRKSGIGLVLHRGAKKRGDAAPAIDDPEALLEWLGDDRAMLAFEGIAELKRRRRAVQAILRQWIRSV